MGGNRFRRLRRLTARASGVAFSADSTGHLRSRESDDGRLAGRFQG